MARKAFGASSYLMATVAMLVAAASSCSSNGSSTSVTDGGSVNDGSASGDAASDGGRAAEGGSDGNDGNDSRADSMPAGESGSDAGGADSSGGGDSSGDAGGSQSYTTNFPLTENPISESGHWTNGATTGIDWGNVETTPGLAFGTVVSGGPPYSDSTAALTGTWGSGQTAQATVHTRNQTGAVYEEVELRLRTSIGAHDVTGYEFNFRCTADGSQYVQIVRWNGALNDFTYLNSTTGPGLQDGDVIKATAVGSTLTSYINGVQQVQATDTTYSGGSPGMGFYNQGGTIGDNADYGFSSYTASSP